MPASLPGQPSFHDALALVAAAPAPYRLEARVALQLPVDHAVPGAPAMLPGRLARDIPAALVTQLRDFRQDEGDCSMLLLTAFTVFLARHTGEQLVRLSIVTAPASGWVARSLSVPSLTIDVQPGDEPSFLALHQRLSGRLRWAAQSLVCAPVAPLSPQDPSAVTFTYRQHVEDDGQLPAQDCAHLAGDLRLEIVDTPSRLQVVWVYRSDRLASATIERMHGRFLTMLHGVVANPSLPACRLPLLTAAEEQQILCWDQTHVSYDLTTCTHVRVAEQARRAPGALAVADAQGQLTYGELNARANQVAHYLRAQGVGPDILVGVCMERSADLVVACLGILKAGGAYVPLDPSYPAERLTFMLADAQVAVLLTQERLRASLALQAPHVVCLDSDWPRLAQESPEDPPETASAADLAYVIYTSGSTGQPKGVQVEHRGLLNLIGWHQQMFCISAADRATQCASPAFDATVWELWPYLSIGASIHIPEEITLLEPNHLQAWLLRQNITICFLPTPLAEQVIDLAWPTKTTLRLLLTGGDRLSRWPRVDLPFALSNNYGPTENTVVSTSGLVVAGRQNGLLPHIGHSIYNVRTYILDTHLQPVPLGAVGELCISGVGLARGYLNRPELTAEKFVADPFHAGARMYRTGDLARYRLDGAIEFLGRIDQQVKLRGFRIELGEIEAVLKQHPSVHDAVVVTRQGEGNMAAEKRLVAYIVPAAGVEPAGLSTARKRSALASDLRVFLQARLPAYMTPAAFVLLKALPLTPNGKVDRRALPALEPDGPSVEGTIAPRTPEEGVLAAIWAQVLGRPAVGVDDDFFALGGHSLLAAHVITLVSTAFQRDIPLRTLFEAPTVAAFARVISSNATAPAPVTLLDLAADVVLDPTISPPSVAHASSTHPPAAIFLTGATGFLGAFLLHELLASTRASIYCLVRAASDEEAGRRIQQTLTDYQIWHDDWRGRIVPLAGDLGKVRLGLSLESFDRLAATVDVIYHAGAQVHYLHPYATLKAPNVQGAVEILRLACQQRAKPVHYISSIAVAGAMSADSHVREDADLGACSSSMGYTQSKWVSEGIMRLARERGLPVAIYRPGRIGSHSQTGVANPNDFFTRLLAGCIQLGLAPAAPLEENLMPVDYAARAIIHLSRQPATANQTFHLLNPEATRWSQVVGAAREFGYPLRLVSYQQWYSALLRAATTNSATMVCALLPFLPEDQTTVRRVDARVHQAAGDNRCLPLSIVATGYIDDLANCTFDMHNAHAGLAGSAIRCPTIDAALLERMFIDGVRRGLLAAPARTP